MIFFVNNRVLYVYIGLILQILLIVEKIKVATIKNHIKMRPKSDIMSLFVHKSWFISIVK